MRFTDPVAVSSDPPRLSIRGVHKRFGATRALAGVDLEIAPGEVHALIGENGAGKSTLMKILSGVHSADAGQLAVDGVPFRPRGPRDALAAGIAMVYQELNLAPHLDATANILLGEEPRGRMGMLDRRTARERAREALEFLGHADVPLDRPVATLSIANQQLVEIARACLYQLRLLIMDEPTSSLARPDVERLFAFIRRLRAKGVGVIYISHFLEECQEIADRYTVLRDGASVHTGTMAGASTSEIIGHMVGRAVDGLYPPIPPCSGPVCLRVDGLSGAAGKPSELSFDLRAGEILGFAGLVGSGRTETLRALFGLDARGAGRVERLRPESLVLAGNAPARMLAAGIGMVSENRKEEGLMLGRSLSENLCATRWSPYRSGVWLREGAVRGAADSLLRRLGVRFASPDQPIGSLSGGNQQKVALGRLLHHGADVLLLDEPTRGIDVGSKAHLYQLLAELVGQGRAIVMVSSYLPELLGMCHRIGVFCRGRLVEIRPRDQWDEHALMRAATGELSHTS